jgi:hypothetical protein
MAPEQAAGRAKEVGPAADVYALGAILYECLTGRPPFRGATAMETLQQVLSAEPVAPRRLQPRAPIDLETVCLRCLRKESARRYGSAGELADDLKRFLAGEAVTARLVAWAERAAKWARRRPAVAALLVAMLLVTLLGVGLVTWQWRAAVAQWNRAEKEKENAEAAMKQAERKTLEEVEARQREKTELERAEQNLYLNRVALAQREWEGSHVSMTVDLLDACPPERRNWEWRYLRRLCQGTTQTMRGHTGIVLAVAFSPDGAQLASGSGDATVKLWDSQAGEETLTLKGHGSSVGLVGNVVSGAF